MGMPRLSEVSARLRAEPVPFVISPISSSAWGKFVLAAGELYLPDDEATPLQVVDILISGKHIDRKMLLGTSEHKLKNNKVYAAAGVLAASHAVKLVETSNRFYDTYESAPSLRAQVLLRDGLEMVEQPGPWHIRGVRTEGLYVPFGRRAHERWLLERVAPVFSSAEMVPYVADGYNSDPQVIPLPSESRRQQLYDSAIVAANGGEPDFSVFYDDDERNMLIERTPIMQDGRVVEQGSAVKIDVEASE